MLYETNLNPAMLNILKARVLGIADCIQVLVENGYIPNKNKLTILQWSIILAEACKNVELFSEEQQRNLTVITNKVLKL